MAKRFSGQYSTGNSREQRLPVKKRKPPDLDRSTELAERHLSASETMAEWSFRDTGYQGDTNVVRKQLNAAGRNRWVRPRKIELLGLIGTKKSESYPTLTGEMAEWSKATVC